MKATIDTSASLARSSEPCANRRRILLVEDNATNQRLMRRLLESMECEVAVASNGREALERLLQDRFDLVFMDCHMPVMDGFDATAEIRRTHRAPSPLPIVAVTASITREDHERCLRVGMNEILTKPVNPDEIMAALDRWCHRQPGLDSGAASPGSGPRVSP